jgi:DNA polymerase/3'-5' exonuclease PolX
MSDEEPKTFPLQDAVPIAEKFLKFLAPHCVPNRILIVGSIRRRKPFVKDIEILFVSKPGSRVDESDMFKRQMDCAAVDLALEKLLELGVIERRLSKVGRQAWGPENKLAVHVRSGMPVDFFYTTEANWFNAIVVRTGPSQSNKAIAAAAIAKGWKWHAYGNGFTRNDGKSSIDRAIVTEERDAFDFVGIPFKSPEKR